ncbi:MAG: hypothetical protein ABFS32_13365 [Bacteroidota bacterium]
MAITIQELTNSKKDLLRFIRFSDSLFKDVKYYVPPLHKSELKTMLIDQNPAYEFCEARFWLLYKDNVLKGRIAGIINHRYNDKTGVKYLRFGWLDFSNDITVLEALLNTVENWGKEIEAEKLHGPLGFSSFDASGILVEGFEELPTSFARYNPPYYSEMLEQLGYKKEVDWVEHRISVPDEIPEKYTRISDVIKDRYGLISVPLRKAKDLMQYGDQIFDLLNVEYADLYSFSQLTQRQINDIKIQFSTILNLEYVSVVTNKDNEVVGFGFCIPSLSKALQKSKGKLYPFGILRIMKALRSNDTVDSLLIAVAKEYQEKGVSAIIFNDVGNGFVRNGIKHVESNRELEDNLSVNNLWNKLESRQHKRARSYVKVLDPSIG